uniref:Uncharacterized protein n=1 Tax=Rhizophora mucronata TaxID=61149 RepID=A0A2P2PWL9_RHIMU
MSLQSIDNSNQYIVAPSIRIKSKHNTQLAESYCG